MNIEEGGELLLDRHSQYGEIDPNLNFLTETQFKPFTQSWQFLKASLPCISQSFGVFILYFSSMMAANYIHNNKIVAGYGLGVTIFNASLYSIIISLNNGLFTQASHAFGAKNYKQVGILLQRAWIIDSTFLIFIFGFVVKLTDILIYFSVEQEISEIAGKYVLYTFPSIIFSLIFDSIKSFMMAHKEFNTPTIIQNIGYGLVPIYLYVFVVIFKMDIVGLSMSRNLAELVNCIFIVYKILQDIKQKQQKSIYYETWIPWDRNSIDFKAIQNYLKISVVIGAVIYLEWSFFEIQTVVVAALHNEIALAAHSSFVGIMLFFFMVPLGMSFSVNSYLGNLMGEGKAKVARNFTKVALFTVVVFAFCFSIVGILLKPIFIRCFTTDEQMAEIFSNIYMIYQLFYFLPDAIQIIMGAILRSLGLQNSSAIMFLIIYYFAGMPISLFLTFGCGLGVYGVWAAFGIVASVVVLCFGYKIYKCDFEKCAQNIKNGLDDQKEVELTEIKY